MPATKETRTMTIQLDGSTYQVLNTLSAGPDCEPTTYELKGGSYVYQVGGYWFLQRRGQFAQKVILQLETPALGGN